MTPATAAADCRFVHHGKVIAVDPLDLELGDVSRPDRRWCHNRSGDRRTQRSASSDRRRTAGCTASYCARARGCSVARAVVRRRERVVTRRVAAHYALAQADAAHSELREGRGRAHAQDADQMPARTPGQGAQPDATRPKALVINRFDEEQRVDRLAGCAKLLRHLQGDQARRRSIPRAGMVRLVKPPGRPPPSARPFARCS